MEKFANDFDLFLIFSQILSVLVLLIFAYLVFYIIKNFVAGMKNIGVIIDRQEEIIDLLQDIKTELQKNNKP